MGILDWLGQAPQRQRAERYTAPPILAYYWDGAAPKGNSIKDISQTGAYIYTVERWPAGTLIAVTLQEAAPAGETTSALAVVRVRCKVVRHVPDGMAIEFLTNQEERKALRHFVNRTAAKADPPRVYQMNLFRRCLPKALRNRISVVPPN